MRRKIEEKLTWQACKALHEQARYPQNGKPIGRNRRIMPRGDDYALQYHRTDVLTYSPDGTVTVDTGGWWTNTTLRVIGDHGHVYLFNDPKKVHTRRIIFRGQSYKEGRPFLDGLKFNSDTGKILNPMPDQIRIVDNDKRKHLVKLVKAYRDGIAIRCKLGVYEGKTAAFTAATSAYWLEALEAQDFSVHTVLNLLGHPSNNEGRYGWQPTYGVTLDVFKGCYARKRSEVLEKMGAYSYYIAEKEGEGK